MNLVHRVILPTEEAVDREAAERASYLEQKEGGTGVSPVMAQDRRDAGPTEQERRFIKSEVGAKAITDLMGWFERQWTDSEDFKEDLIELVFTVTPTPAA